MIDREVRKEQVFHIMYGTYPLLTDKEHHKLRVEARRYINGERDTVPVAEEVKE